MGDVVGTIVTCDDSTESFTALTENTEADPKQQPERDLLFEKYGDDWLQGDKSTIGFQELAINFPPSYRHHKKNDEPLAGADGFTPNLESPEWKRTYGNNDRDGHNDGKARMPWWTDRVFCKITPDLGNGD